MNTAPLEDAPNVTAENALRCLVFIADTLGHGWHMGRVWRRSDGSAHAAADGFNGDWTISHFMRLPVDPGPESTPS